MANTAPSPTGVIAGFEGYRSRPYWDNNAWRIGYGSDTVTRSDGTIEHVTPQTTVTQPEAQADLARRTAQSQQSVIRSIGQTAWDNLTPAAQAAATSVAYNYGSLTGLPSLVRALQSGDPQSIATAIEARGTDNNGQNATRRTAEAGLVLGHPVPGADVGGANAIPAALPTGIDLSAYNGGTGNSALSAIGAATTPGAFANAPGQVGQAPPVPLAPPVGSVQSTFNRLGMAPAPSDALTAYVNAKAASMAPNASGSPNDRMSADQQTMQNLGAPMTSADASGFYSGFPLGSPALSPTQIAGVGNGAALPSSGASGSGSISLPPPLPMIANIGPAASPSNFPARPGMVGSNGSAPYDFNYGAPANPVSVKPYTPGQSVADINLNDALYPNGQPTYASQGALPDIPKWAMPSVPVTVIPPGRGSTVVNGAVNSAIRSAAPDIAAALGPVFGGARSLVDNLPSMTAPPSVPQSVASSFPARPSVVSPNNTGGTNYSAPAPTSYESSGWDFGIPNANVPVYGSGMGLGTPPINSGSSSYAMNDPSGSGNTYSQPKTITQQVLNPAWTQWQAQSAPGDSQFSGTDTGLSWAGLNTGDPNDPFSSFQSPANRPATPAPPKYLTINKPNPNYVTPPLANPTGGNWFADRFNGSHVGRLLTLFGGGQNASDMLFGGGGQTGMGAPPIFRSSMSTPAQIQSLAAAMTPTQIANSNPAALTALKSGQSSYTNGTNPTLVPTLTISGTVRNSYGDSSSGSGSLSSAGGGNNPVWKDGRWQ